MELEATAAMNELLAATAIIRRALRALTGRAPVGRTVCTCFGGEEMSFAYRHARSLVAASALLTTAIAIMSSPVAAQVIVGDPEVIGDPTLIMDCGEDRFQDTPCFAVVTNKELFITDPCVVDDPCRTRWDLPCPSSTKGAWTFGKLAASMAGFPTVDTDPSALSDFVLNWLNQHLNAQMVNGQLIDGRPDMAEFIDEWVELSEALGGPRGEINMKIAPFRLLAVVNRMDLRDAPSGYAEGNAGEGRFVFNFLNIPDGLAEDVKKGLDPDVDPTEWDTRFANVILEYSLPAETCGDILDWANRFHALGALDFGTTFNAALQDITDDFAGFNVDPSRPNGSSLNQLRTNEIEFSFSNEEPVWELREFKLLTDSIPSQLTQVVVALTVDTDLQDSALLGQWMTLNEIPINHDAHSIPLTFGAASTPFAAGSSINPGTGPVSTFFWDVPDTFDFDCSDTRHNFALNNCNGCHARETDVTAFFQVHPRDFTEESVLTEFLIGAPFDGTSDPTCFGPPTPGAVIRFFNDIARRALDMCEIIDTGCEKGNNTALEGDEKIFKTPNVLKIRVH
jgi:hypothetical protein